MARIAVGGIMHETNTFSTVPTTYADMRISRGEELLRHPAWAAIRGRGHTLLPLLTAHATPSGPLRRPDFQRLLDELLRGIERSLPLQGLVLQLHGAMEVEELGDGETAIMRAVRDLVGPKVRIAMSLDLHANLAPEVARECAVVSAYRTAPHRDGPETVARAATLLARCLELGSDPATIMVKLPLLLGGESAVTEAEPARSLFRKLPSLDRERGILCASILIGCAWTDSPHSTVSVVVSGTDRGVIFRAANMLARDIWAKRADFRIESPCAEPEEAIRLAEASERHPVLLSDSGDNATAGAAGDTPLMLELLVRAGAQGALVAGLSDVDALARCRDAGVGATLELDLGAKLDRTNARPYRSEARVLRLGEGAALLEVRGVHLAIQEARSHFTRMADFRALGIDPAAYRIVVVKLGYLFPELRDFAPAHIMALTPGFADQRLERLPYQNIPRPVYPLDADAVWELPV